MSSQHQVAHTEKSAQRNSLKSPAERAKLQPESLGALQGTPTAAVLHLQKSIGNRAVNRLLVQKKGSVAPDSAPSCAEPPPAVVGHTFTANMLQLERGLIAGKQVKVLQNIEGKWKILAGVVQKSLTKEQADDAYEVKLGEDNTISVDQGFVFNAAMKDEQIMQEMNKVMELSDFNASLTEGMAGKNGLKSYDKKTLNGSWNASTKMINIANTSYNDLQDKDASKVAKSAIQAADKFISLHPFHEGNGRTMLYMIYDVALQRGYQLKMTPLELHRHTLSEDQLSPIERSWEVVASGLEKFLEPIDERFDKKIYLEEKKSGLLTLEYDRKNYKQQLAKEAQKFKEMRLNKEEIDGTSEALNISSFETALAKELSVETEDEICKSVIEALTKHGYLLKDEDTYYVFYQKDWSDNLGIKLDATQLEKLKNLIAQPWDYVSNFY